MPLSLSQNQAAFSAALLTAGLSVPENVVRPDGRRADLRFAIYRNNLAVSLIDALQANFPVTYKLVGDQFFRVMAGEYIRAEIPKSPILSEYGDSFPKFISSFRPAQDLPYLSDVAAVELAWTQSYHAADALSLSSFEGVNANELVEAVCTMHPSVRFVSSASPIGAIWLGHQVEPFTSPKEWNSESVMLVRPDADVVLHFLGDAELTFVQQLCRGERVEDAAIAALEKDTSFNAGACLVKLLRVGAITSIRIHEHIEANLS